MSKDPDANKGAVAQDRPDETSNVSMTGQNAHRNKSETMQGQDSDFPEPGENEEHSMEGHTQHSRFGGDPANTSSNQTSDGEQNDQDPGERQQRSQNDRKEDPLAS